MKDVKKELNRSPRTILIFIATLMLIGFSGLVYYLVIQLPAKQAHLAIIEKEKLIIEYQNSQERKLESCLNDAKKRAQDTFIINSYPDAREGYPDARTWTSFEVQAMTEKQFNEATDFCLQRYK